MKKGSRRLARRTFLAASAMGGLALPFLRTLRTRAEETFPTRLVIVYFPNGVRMNTSAPDDWTASGGDTSLTLSRIQAPLERHKSDLVVLEGVDMTSSYTPDINNDHPPGQLNLLTGKQMVPVSDRFAATSISVDQFIANRIGSTTRFPSVELGLRGTGEILFRGPDEKVPHERNPYNAFDRLFADIAGSTDPFGLERLRAERRSVLDQVTGEIGTLQSELGTDDRRKLDAHLESLRTIERGLDGSTASATCAPPMLGSRIDIDANDSYPTVGRLHMDIIAMALACNLTRVATLQWNGSNTVHTWLGIDKEHHQMAHDMSGLAIATEWDYLTRINIWYMEQLASLIDKLKAIPEGAGTMFDHTVVLLCNEQKMGATHRRENLPLIVAGSAGGQIRTGRFLRFSAAPHNNLLVSLCQVMGVGVDTFGDPAVCTGALSGLVG